MNPDREACSVSYCCISFSLVCISVLIVCSFIWLEVSVSSHIKKTLVQSLHFLVSSGLHLEGEGFWDRPQMGVANPFYYSQRGMSV